MALLMVINGLQSAARQYKFDLGTTLLYSIIPSLASSNTPPFSPSLTTNYVCLNTMPLYSPLSYPWTKPLSSRIAVNPLLCWVD